MLARIRQIVSAHDRLVIDVQDRIPAAVLVPLIVREGELLFLMEKRTDKVDHHKGQISFPGGSTDPQDRDAIATALREAQEEVGLGPQQVEVLGLMDDIVTITNFLVTPVVASIPSDVQYRLSEFEVEEIIEVPWSVFSKGPNHHTVMEHAGTEFDVDAYEHGGHVIWGATARIVRALVDLVESKSEAKLQEVS